MAYHGATMTPRHVIPMVCDGILYQTIPWRIPWYTMVFHGIPWYTMVSHGVPWYSMVYHGIPWYTMVYHGIPWYTMVYHGIPWYTMVYHGIPWYTMVYHEIPWYTMVHHATPCYTMRYHGAPRYTMGYHLGIPRYTMVYHSIPWYTKYNMVWPELSFAQGCRCAKLAKWCYRKLAGKQCTLIVPCGTDDVTRWLCGDAKLSLASASLGARRGDAKALLFDVKHWHSQAYLVCTVACPRKS